MLYHEIADERKFMYKKNKIFISFLLFSLGAFSCRASGLPSSGNSFSSAKSIILGLAIGFGIPAIIKFYAYKKQLARSTQSNVLRFRPRSSKTSTDDLDEIGLCPVDRGAQALLKLTDTKLLLNDKMNTTINPGISEPIRLTQDSCMMQLFVLWQILSESDFTKKDISQSMGDNYGIIKERWVKIYREGTLGNGLSFLRRQSINANSFDSIAGGVASCAYQAIKNSTYILAALFAGTQEQYDKSLEKLWDIPYAQLLFDTNPRRLGKWRERIIQEREKKLYRWYIEKELNALNRAYLIKEESAKSKQPINGIRFQRIYGIYEKLLGDIKIEITNDIIDHFYNATVKQTSNRQVSKRIKCSIASIIKAIQARRFGCAQSEGETADINEVIKKDSTFEQFFKLKAADYEKEFIYSAAKTKEISEEYRQAQKGIPLSLDGENLTADEIKLIIDLEKERHGFLENFRDIAFSIVEPPVASPQDGTIVAEGESDLAKAVFDIRQKLKKESDNYCHVFLLNGDGHWITVVVNKCDAVIQYIIADSMNIPRYGGDYVHQAPPSELTTQVQKLINTCEHYFHAR